MSSYKNWSTEPCFHCGGHGVVAGWDIPDECTACGGSGRVWISPKGRIADYPGGPFRGSIGGKALCE